MKLLIITQKYDFNDSNLGAFIDWWDRLAQKVEKIYILTLEKKSEPTEANIEVISMGKEKGIGLIDKIIGFYNGIFKIAGKADAILVHMVPKYVILIAPIAFILGKPIYMWYTGVAVHWQLRFAVIFCKKVFTAHAAAMRINTPKRIVTGHGIDTSKFQIISPEFKIQEPFTILSVGRITPSKGHDLIIRAAADLKKSDYNLKLKVIGGVIQNYHKKYLEFLKKTADKLNLDGAIEFSGPVSYGKIPNYFKNADILVNAVPFGGLDKAVLEAMSSGVIPLTSNNAFSDVFPEHIAKYLIFEQGSVKDLEFKLKNIFDKKFYRDEKLRLKLRSIVVKSHNLDNLIMRLVNEMSV